MKIGRPRSIYPEKYCQHCKKKLIPKKYPSSTECLSQFLIRQYCTRQCAMRNIGKTRTQSEDLRFWSKVDKSKGLKSCWPWKGKLDKDGYGRFSTGKHRKQKWHRAHRFAFYLSKGYLTDLYILHRCDNPACCNPNHLFEGTQKDNVLDCKVKGRIAKGNRSGPRLHPECMLKGEKHPKSKNRSWDWLK
jgi:hypothetical protein